MNYPYTLRIVGPSPEDIRENDPGTWAEIQEGREPDDTDEAAVRRYLGGIVAAIRSNRAEAFWLPDGWYLKVEE